MLSCFLGYSVLRRAVPRKGPRIRLPVAKAFPTVVTVAATAKPQDLQPVVQVAAAATVENLRAAVAVNPFWSLSAEGSHLSANDSEILQIGSDTLRRVCSWKIAFSSTFFVVAQSNRHTKRRIHTFKFVQKMGCC